jgi:hypothetical protein
MVVDMATSGHVKQPTLAERQYLFGFDYFDGILCQRCEVSLKQHCEYCQDVGWWTIEDFYVPDAWYKKA